jgi:hypothetical protein
MPKTIIIHKAEGRGLPAVYCPMTDAALHKSPRPEDPRAWCLGAITGEPCWSECEAAALCDAPQTYILPCAVCGWLNARDGDCARCGESCPGCGKASCVECPATR